MRSHQIESMQDPQDVPDRPDDGERDDDELAAIRRVEITQKDLR